MWYADHDEYTTYAFYFDNKVNFDNAVVIDLLCGKADSNTLSLCGLSDLSSLVDAADKNISYNGSSSSSSDSSAGESESYATALADAKKGADIMFEQKTRAVPYSTARDCTIPVQTSTALCSSTRTEQRRPSQISGSQA